MLTFLGLSHMVDATQHDGVGGGVGGDNIRCTCTHGFCYATCWGGGWGGV